MNKTSSAQAHPRSNRKSPKRATGVGTTAVDRPPELILSAPRRSVRERVREEPEQAFIPGPDRIHGPVPDDLAEYLGENFVASVTTGSDVEADAQDDVMAAEIGGPFIETDAATQFGSTMSAADDFADEPTLPEAFPTAVRSGVEPIAPPATGRARK